MKINRALLWGYLSEAIAATLIHTLLALSLPSEKINLLILTKANEIATLFASVMFAATLGFLWSFYTKSDTPFFLWLYSKGAYQAYLTSYIFSAATFGLLITLLILGSFTKEYYIPQASTWMTIYCFLISISFVNNIREQLILNMEYNKAQKERE